MFIKDFWRPLRVGAVMFRDTHGPSLRDREVNYTVRHKNLGGQGPVPTGELIAHANAISDQRRQRSREDVD